MRRFLDATLGKWLRHFLFILVRSYYTLFYNVSCSNKHLLQEHPGALIIATHVSRHDGPMLSAVLYSSARVRPTVHYDEYYNWAQFLPMFLAAAIPMSSPKTWEPEARAARKEHAIGVVHKVLENGNSILIFPAGKIRRQPEEIVAPYLSGVYDILRAKPDIPLLLLRIDGIGQFQPARYDGFWSFLGRKNGRRHVNIDIQPLTTLDANAELADFNATLEKLLNTPI